MSVSLSSFPLPISPTQIPSSPADASSGSRIPRGNVNKEHAVGKQTERIKSFGQALFLFSFVIRRKVGTLYFGCWFGLLF